MRWIFRLAVLAAVALSGLIIVNSLPYFSGRTALAFLEEKGPLAHDPVWRATFLGHLFGGIVCFLTAPLLFWNGLLVRFPKLHRWLGRVYGVAVLGWAGPTGLYLSFFAKGGLAGKSAFLVLGLLWWGATARGVQLIVAKRVAEHLRWMTRSYVIALSAVFFRLYHVVFFYAGLADDPNYGLSLWLSLATSLVVGEWLVRRAPAGLHPLPLKGALS